MGDRKSKRDRPKSARVPAKAARKDDFRDDSPESPRPDPQCVDEPMASPADLVAERDELRRCQQEAADLRTQFSRFYDFAPVGYLALSEEGVVLQANRTAETLLGVERSQLPGKSFFSFVAEPDRDAGKSHLHEVLEKRVSRTCDLRVMSRLGGPVWLRLESIIASDGSTDSRRIWTILTDATQWRQAEDELSACDVSYHSLFNAADEALLVHDLATGKILDVNPAMCQMYGVTPEEARRMGVEDLCCDEPGCAWEDAYQRFAEALRDGRSVFQWHARRKSGEPFWAETSLRPVVIAGHRRILAAVRDVTSRKQMEDSLVESQRKLWNAVRIAKLGYWEYDVASDLFTFDDDFYAIFGTTAENVGGHTISPERYAELFVHPEDRHVVTDEVRVMLESDPSVTERQLEHRMVYADGHTGHIAVHFIIVRDERGRAVKTYGANQDITARKQVEEELRRQHDFSESLIETAQAIVLVLDSQGRIVRFNRYMEHLCGYRLSEVEGRLWFDTFVPRADQERIGEVFAQSLRDVPARRVVNPIVTKDGSQRMIEWYDRTLKDSQGNVAGIVAVGHDITDRLRAEAALRQSEERFRRAVESIPDVIVIYDRDLRIRYINAAARQVTGRPQSDFVGKREEEIWPPEVYGVYHPMLRDSLQSGQRRRLVTDVPISEGGTRHLDITCVPLADEQGNVQEVVGITHDLTERKQAEEALRQAHDELEARVAARTNELAATNLRLREEMAERQRIEARERQLEADLAHVGRLTTMGEMASGLAHELNQPLAAIVLQSEVITRMAADNGETLSPDVVRSLEFITKQAHRAGDLIRRMRGFVQHAAPKRVVVTMAEVVDEVWPLVQRDLQDSGVAIEMKMDDPPVRIVADKVQLQQVLLNLVRNAIEAMEGVKPDQRRLWIERHVRDNMVEVIVRDTGHGIAPDDKDKLFKAFYSTKTEGMGMGLSICRTIVESHGGRIWASPNADQGTTFTFTLPIATEDGDYGTETSRIPRR